MISLRMLEPPYYAVIFSSQRSPGDNGYEEASARMEALVRTMPGFLGVESVRDKDGFGVTISYWESEAAIANWKKNAEHLEVQRCGRANWYENYTTHVAKVERAYEMKKQGKAGEDNNEQS